MAALGEQEKEEKRKKKRFSLSFNFFFRLCPFFLASFTDLEKRPVQKKKIKKKKKKKKKKKLNIQLLEAGLSVDTLQEG